MITMPFKHQFIKEGISSFIRAARDSTHYTDNIILFQTHQMKGDVFTHTMSHQTYQCHQLIQNYTRNNVSDREENKQGKRLKTKLKQTGARYRWDKHLTLDLFDQEVVFMLSLMESESQTGTEVNKPLDCEQLLFCGLQDALCMESETNSLKRETEDDQRWQWFCTLPPISYLLHGSQTSLNIL